MSEPNISYEGICLFLNSKEEYMEELFENVLKGGRLFEEDERGIYIAIQDKCIANVYGIQTPFSLRGKLSSDDAIFDSALRLVGDFGNNLERLTLLSEEGKICQDNLYFDKRGFPDYSNEKHFDFKKVTEWVKLAQDYTHAENKDLPDDMEKPEREIFGLVPTFQSLRDLKNLGGKRMDTRGYFIVGETFAQSVQNFFDMYDATLNHVGWLKKRESMIHFGKEKGNSEGKPYVAKVIL